MTKLVLGEEEKTLSYWIRKTINNYLGMRHRHCDEDIIHKNYYWRIFLLWLGQYFRSPKMSSLSHKIAHSYNILNILQSFLYIIGNW